MVSDRIRVVFPVGILLILNAVTVFFIIDTLRIRAETRMTREETNRMLEEALSERDFVKNYSPKPRLYARPPDDSMHIMIMGICVEVTKHWITEDTFTSPWDHPGHPVELCGGGMPMSAGERFMPHHSLKMGLASLTVGPNVTESGALIAANVDHILISPGPQEERLWEYLPPPEKKRL